jgi:hypothetical protein
VRYTYGGGEPQTYPQYLDAAKGTTLVAEPGQTYDVAQVEGLTVPGAPDKAGATSPVEVKLPMPPDDRWTAPKSSVRAARDTEES